MRVAFQTRVSSRTYACRCVASLSAPHGRRKILRMWLVALLAHWNALTARPQLESRPAISVEAAHYLSEGLATMRENSFHREELDWPAIRKAAFEAAAGAEVPADTYEALRGALRSLGDRHSFLQLPAELAELEGARLKARGKRHAAARAPDPSAPASPFAGRSAPEGTAHETPIGPIARIVVPFFMGADANGFARRVQDLVVELDRRGPRGWIIDLRGNGGGNMWPMLAGIGPVLGEGRVGSFVTADGPGGHWFYRAGKAGIEDGDGAKVTVVASVEHPHVVGAPTPVVVLIDAGTASSGEAVAIAFKGRPRTRFVGTATFGLSSSNAGFPMSDGANLVITVGLDVDRTGKQYPDHVLPDEVVEGPRSLQDEDLQLARALDWLVEQSE